METTKLSSKGQVIIPKPLRASHGWEPGQELVVIDTGDGVLLKPKMPFQETSINDVASCLRYEGEPKTLDDMEQAIRRGVKERIRDSG
ncbi:MAG: AbrB/MazE/SpoVT family DNA-binding domain-containing protein [Candidatus Competibacteraceae bacterium]|nr:AbrB/MazE/SpoVT family DNA-binding domain-containing protein [Candidatus Competibacteraceae bacterium]